MTPPLQRDRALAQQTADRIRSLRDELASGELADVLALTPEQRKNFDDWSRAKLAVLAEHFDIDTTASQKRVSWGMRIASTLGALAVCAAVVLFFNRYWGYMQTWLQLCILLLTPLLALVGAEYMARRERTRYFTGLLSLVALASFIMNLAVIGDIFNIVSTERALLVWGAFAVVLAYRYGLRFILAVGLLLLASYADAAFTSQLGYRWLDFAERPENFLVLGPLVFAAPFVLKHTVNGNFPAVYRLVGALIFFMGLLTLAEWGQSSYLPWDDKTIERFYEIVGLLFSAGAVWLGITRGWNGIVNTGATFFTVFLFTRLYHWWWDWMPKYLFFAIIGALGIGLVIGFRYLRQRIVRLETEVLPA